MPEIMRQLVYCQKSLGEHDQQREQKCLPTPFETSDRASWVQELLVQESTRVYCTAVSIAIMIGVTQSARAARLCNFRS